MSANSYVPISWNPTQLLDQDTLNQYSANMNNIRNEAVDGLYQHRLGGVTGQGLKILCGFGSIATNKSKNADLTVSFAKMFSTDSTPSVVCTPVSFDLRPIFMTVKGIGRTLPNHQGFVARLTVDNVGSTTGSIKHALYINWIAMGY